MGHLRKVGKRQSSGRRNPIRGPPGCIGRSHLEPLTIRTGRHRLWTNRQGGVAVIFALSSTVLIGLAGGGIDYARLSARRSQVQNALDMAVLAGGNTLKAGLGDTSPQRRHRANPARQRTIPPDRLLTVQVTVPADMSSVLATASKDFKFAFGPFIGVRSAYIALQSKANVVGKMRLCMLTLDPAAPATFDLENGAQVTASDCSLYSNSSNPNGTQTRPEVLRWIRRSGVSDDVSVGRHVIVRAVCESDPSKIE
ncbi:MULTISPECIES: TadE/TadG family type IV pilus assembly protein [Methylobacterium]|uniref:TadE/TadG family type IV pilus assembly protein n=1 Tax=Methylobacterium TaxID=407 RepID=UPI00257D560A|nr:TadE/TadG family type IV pilus assembly protein [Methylobacterium sp.]